MENLSQLNARIEKYNPGYFYYLVAQDIQLRPMDQRVLNRIILRN